MLGLKEKSSGDFRYDKEASFQAHSVQGASWEPASRLNCALDGALLQLFYVVLNLYWCWKTKAHLISIKITARRKSVLRLTDCKIIERLLGLVFFKDANNLN